MVWRRILRCCEGAVNLVTALALVLCGSFGAYALWDNGQVLASAADVRETLLQWKPEPAAAEEGPDNGESFFRLREVNPEIRGWITMEDTGIDFPVVQGQNNLSYINRDVFGNFSLAGSIFLDSRDDPEFGEGYALLYGHHMADGNMFGDLDKYRDPEFFAGSGTGQLILPRGTLELRAAAVLVVSAAEKRIFDPEYVRGMGEKWLEFVREEAVLLREEALGEGAYLALTTCASDFTDARTVVLARMEGGTE